MTSRTISPTRLSTLLSEAAAAHRVTVDAVLTRRIKDRPARTAAQEVMMRLRDDGFSFPQIGRAFGVRHTTVMYALGLVA